MTSSMTATMANLAKAREAKQARRLRPTPALARIQLSGDGERSAMGKYCCTKARRLSWIAEHDLFVADDGRAYALVDTRSEVFFMDAITGALVALGDGRHQTNEFKRVGGFRRDHVGAADILMRAFTDAEGADAEDGDGL